MNSEPAEPLVPRVIVSVEPDGTVSIDGAPCWSRSDDGVLLSELNELVQSRRVHLVVTPNVDQVLTVNVLPEFRSAFRSATLRLLDGMPLVLLARSLGARGIRRYTGADLLPLVAKASVQFGWRVVLAGGTYQASTEAAARLNEQVGSQIVTAVDFPILDGLDDPRSHSVVQAIAEIEPSFVFLGLGSPKQELWFKNWSSVLPAAVYVGSGAAADFVAGQARRAPRWAQKLGAEWIWRLAQEPARLSRRYLVRGPRFLMVIWASHAAALSRLLHGNPRNE